MLEDKVLLHVKSSASGRVEAPITFWLMELVGTACSLVGSSSDFTSNTNNFSPLHYFKRKISKYLIHRRKK